MAPNFTAATAVAILPKPVSTTTRALGRVSCRLSTTSRPLPSSSLRSTTAKAGGFSFTMAMPSRTVSAIVTSKPRACIARARRSRNGRSSSRMRRLFSSGNAGSLISSCFHARLHRGYISSRPAFDHTINSPSEPQLLAGRGIAIDGASWPGRRHRRAATHAVVGGNHAAGLLDQGLGNEKPEAHALLFAVRRVHFTVHGTPPGRARGDVGFADLLENLRRESRAIVHYFDH